MGAAAKRALDLGGSAAGLVLLSPVMAAVAAAVLLSAGRPVIFRQLRPGRGGRPFEMYKFRTMRNAAGEELRDEERITRVGRWLRSTSLDELPELVNVLRGEMSLVGPRPLLMEYLGLYTPEQARRHEVKPGITGWAQVQGRNRITWDRRFELDLWYVENRSFWLDLKVLAMTLGRVVRGEGVHTDHGALMPRFQGDAPPRPPAGSPDAAPEGE
jgi:sugar transferase EpsL